MDFLETTVRRNPELINSAFRLHGEGKIPSNTYLIDIDSVKKNAQALANAAKKAGISNYFMTKQFGRNPLVAKAIINSGIPSAVAIDIQEVKSLHRNGIKVDHVGHLVQVPTREMDFVVGEVRPEIVTVYSIEKAKEVNGAAAKFGLRQKIMLRPIGPSDSFGSTQEGGTPLRELVQMVRSLTELQHVQLSGLTSFPSFRYDLRLGTIRKTTNYETMKQAQKIIERECSIRIEQINAPGSNCASAMSILAQEGATHGEPGHAFAGTTPWHAFEDLPEVPAWVYVTEVSHVVGDRAYSFSGGLPQSGYHGFFTTLYHQNFLYALVGHGGNYKQILAEPPSLVTDVQAWPDFYTTLRCDSPIESGETVVFGFRPQVYTTRSRVAVVRGVGTGRDQVLGVFDRNGNLLANDDGPATRAELRSLMQQV
jgi:predicted amino acid racemase